MAANLTLMAFFSLNNQKLINWVLTYSKLFDILTKLKLICAGVMELADVLDSKSSGRDTVPVRPRSPAPKNQRFS